MNSELAQKTASAVGGASFDCLDQALAWGADGVIVATPHTTHIPIAMKALEKCKRVLVEKPVSHSLEGLDLLRQRSEELGGEIYVVCNMRFHSAVESLRNELGSLGGVFFSRAYYGNYLPNMRPVGDYKALYAASKARGGGVILDAIHEIDYLQQLFGPADSVLCHADKLSDLEIDVEDYAALTLSHGKNVKSEIHLDYLQQAKRRGCEIVGENGTLTWESLGKNPEQCVVKKFDKFEQKWAVIYSNEDEPANLAYEKMAVEFRKALSGLPHALASLDEGVSALRSALGAIESAKKNMAITFESSR